MRKYFIFLIVMIFITVTRNSLANNLIIPATSVSLTGQTSSKTVNVKFDIQWENSWRFVNDGTSSNDNRDAVWVFIKYSFDGGANWYPAYLQNSGHIMGTGTGLEAVVPPDTVNANGDVLGVFLQRNSRGSGPVNTTGVQLVWHWGANTNLDKTKNVLIKVFGIEMVYIPTGSFKIGANSKTDKGTFYTVSGTNNFAAFQINSTYEIQSFGISPTASSTGITWDNGANTYGAPNAGSPSGTINTYFPKGYKAFYMMKYEISQGEYADFLNTLSTPQQPFRVADPTKYFVMSAFNKPSPYVAANVNGRNYIHLKSGVYGTDYNGNDIINEIDLNGNAIDGQAIACNYLQWTDLAAFAGWAGLRPMTEFEYEKAARGLDDPVSQSYVWGSSKITSPSAILNGGTYMESVPEIGQDGVSNFNSASTIKGPLRSGFAAKAYQSKLQSGSSYYGVMDLTGNLWEMVVSVGNSTGTQMHDFYGQGILSPNANAIVQYWPGANATNEVTTATGSGLRGGAFTSPVADATYNTSELHTSDRSSAAVAPATRQNNYGGRCVKTAP